ncbi:putative secreted protein [Sinobacterium caligoides]|uniref:Putative secreted protein n=1 Tax=Sinobacterium caligoides TaxID=933926 RepID=A0A3N2DZQ5_9GAMM|nr:hypothetical protein [Sinobacterium caligoides]ROS04919.1 putative secreted protein [Sinobacterium caligoides]
MFKFITKATCLITMAIGLTCQAESIELFNGSITDANGALASLTPVDTTFSGSFDYTEETEVATYANVILAGFCFNTTANGAPPATSDCPGDKSAVPFLADGQNDYDPEPLAIGTNFLQVDSDIDLTYGGLVKLLAYSPSFNVNILIDIELFENGNATLTADAGFLGSTSGVFTWTPKPPPVIVPVPASIWLFITALAGLFSLRKMK